MSERPVISSSCTNTGSESTYDDTADSEGLLQRLAIDIISTITA
jgi:hypothetical protein